MTDDPDNPEWTEADFRRAQEPMANVVEFKPEAVGETYRFDADEILDAAKGEPFTTLVILGEMENGERYIAGNANAGETLIMMERAKLDLIQGD